MFTLNVETGGIVHQTANPLGCYVDVKVTDAIELRDVVDDMSEDSAMNALSRLVDDAVMFDRIERDVRRIVMTYGIPVPELIRSMLTQYVERMSPLIDDPRQTDLWYRRVLSHRLRDIEDEIERHLESNRKSSVIILDREHHDDKTKRYGANVRVKWNRDDVERDPIEFRYRYEWKFSPALGDPRDVRVYTVGYTDSKHCDIALSDELGDGTLSCSVSIDARNNTGDTKWTRVRDIRCENSLTVVIRRECVRCGHWYGDVNVVHGSCRFHPKPDRYQRFISDQYKSPPMSWVDFKREFDRLALVLCRQSGAVYKTYRKACRDVTHRYGVDDAFLHARGGMEDFLLNRLTEFPFVVTLNVIRLFPWAWTYNTVHGEDSFPALGHSHPVVFTRVENRRTRTEVPCPRTTAFMIDKMSRYVDTVESNAREWCVRNSKDALYCAFSTMKQLMRTLPSYVWNEDARYMCSSRESIPDVYGYDRASDVWKCCGQYGISAVGCWTDVHSQIYDSIRYLGDMDQNDIRGSYNVYDARSFERTYDELRYLFIDDRWEDESPPVLDRLIGLQLDHSKHDFRDHSHSDHLSNYEPSRFYHTGADRETWNSILKSNVRSLFEVERGFKYGIYKSNTLVGTKIKTIALTPSTLSSSIASSIGSDSPDTFDPFELSSDSDIYDSSTSGSDGEPNDGSADDIEEETVVIGEPHSESGWESKDDDDEIVDHGSSVDVGEKHTDDSPVSDADVDDGWMELVPELEAFETSSSDDPEIKEEYLVPASSGEGPILTDITGPAEESPAYDAHGIESDERDGEWIEYTRSHPFDTVDDRDVHYWRPEFWTDE
jgi:hypothetical protein